jgi:NTP pyrophosphatase (non-canonical NTP hydrolase)
MSNKWIREQNEQACRRLGKTGEELGEAVAVVTRAIIQGVEEIDPSSGKTNRQRMEEEFADVLAQIQCDIDFFGLDFERMQIRMSDKMARMRAWEDHFK